MPGRFLEIPVFLGDYFIMQHPVYTARKLFLMHGLIAFWLSQMVTMPSGFGTNLTLFVMCIKSLTSFHICDLYVTRKNLCVCK